MKKIISIMLILIMTSMCMLSGFAPAVAGATPPDGALIVTPGETTTIQAINYTALTSPSKKEGSNISFQKSGVATFEVWTEKAGNYTFFIKYGTGASATSHKFAVSVNGTAFTVPTFPGTGGYTKYRAEEACGIALNAGMNTVKVTTVSGACYFNAIIFEPYKDIALSAVTTNLSEDVTSGSVARGTDSFEITLSQKHKKDTAEAEGAVILKDETGANLPVAVSSDGETITVKLKKSLDYSKNYTLVLNGIQDAAGISAIENKEIPFATTDTDLGTESATISVLESSIDEDKIYIKSETKSSADVAIEGRTVTLKLLKPDGTPVDGVLYEGVSGENGISVINATLPEGLTDSGVYTLLVSCEYAAVGASLSMPYVTETDKILFIGDIEEAKKQENPAAAVMSVYTAKASLLGMDIAEDTLGMANPERIFAHIAKDVPANGEEIITKYEKYLALEKMNQATTISSIEDVLNSEKLCDYLGLSSTKLNLIVNEKSFLLQAIFELEDIQDSAQFINTVNKLIDEAYAKEYKISAVEIVADNVSCFVGQVATTDISLAAKTDKIASIKIVVSAENAASLNDLSVTAEEGFETEIKDVDGAKEITFTLKEAKDAIEKIGKIEFKNTDTAGTCNVKLNGEITYDVGTDEAVKTFFTEKAITITVSSNGNSGGGSGATSTTRPAGTPSKPSTSGGTVVVTPPAEKEEPKDEPKEEEPTVEPDEYSFSDLASFDWAKEAISELVELGVISKSDDNNFNPSRNVTRAEFVKMVIVAFGLEEEGAKSELADVAADAWYNTYVAAAEKNGIVSGDAEGNFNGDANITRQDMAVIIKRAFEKKGLTIQAVSGSEFADDANIADYAKDAVYMMKAAQIINGMGENTFAPADNATRAQAAKVIYETVKAVAGK